jgi:hypothetical protein
MLLRMRAEVVEAQRLLKRGNDSENLSSMMKGHL